GELVEEFVEYREALFEAWEGFAQFLQRRLELVDDRQDLARERTDFVLDDRRARLEQRARGDLCGRERIGKRLELGQGRPRHGRCLCELAEPALCLGQCARQQVQRSLEALVLFGEGLEDGVGGIDHL